MPFADLSTFFLDLRTPIGRELLVMRRVGGGSVLSAGWAGFVPRLGFLRLDAFELALWNG